MTKANLTGQRFGSLVVTSKVTTTKSGSIWECRCDCGGSIERLTSTLKNIRNPGCKSCEAERRSAIHSLHGESRGANRGGKTKLYQIWKGIHGRCRDSGNTSYPYYGGKGISVSPEWSDYVSFRDWALAVGYVEGLSIDRRTSSDNYGPDTCEFVTRAENTRRMMQQRRTAQ